MASFAGAPSQYATLQKQLHPHRSQPHPPQTSYPSYPLSFNHSGLVCNVHHTTGDRPPPYTGSSLTIAGDKLYMFGGRLLHPTKNKVSNDIYEFDLLRRQWTLLEVTGDIPVPRYFHTICLLGNSKLVCYGGAHPRNVQYPHPPSLSRRTTPKSNEALFLQAQRDAQEPPLPSRVESTSFSDNLVTLSDIHIFDIPTRTWTFVPADNPPIPRYAHCATITPSSTYFSSSTAPHPLSPNGRSNTVTPGLLDGTGGAELVIVGGQNRQNQYIDQIAIFNLRSLKWTSQKPLSMQLGCYRASVFPLRGMKVEEIGALAERDRYREVPDESSNREKQSKESSGKVEGTPLVMYANFNVVNTKLQLTIRLPNGQLIDKEVQSDHMSPPGLRFPFTTQISDYLLLGGVWCSKPRQEYVIWALNLRTFAWSRVDAGGAVLCRGSWNSGLYWPQRNKFVIFGNCDGNMDLDYKVRRVNFRNVCSVELEGVGHYTNPRREYPTSNFISASAPSIPPHLWPQYEKSSISAAAGGGRQYAPAAVELGRLAMSLTQAGDMELMSVEGQLIPVNSHILSRRWGPYFIRLLREATAASRDGALVAAILKERATHAAKVIGAPPPYQADHLNRMSTATIRPSQNLANLGSNRSQSIVSSTTTLPPYQRNPPSTSSETPSLNEYIDRPVAFEVASSCLELPTSRNLLPTTRPRCLYLPHTYPTIKLLVYYLYTSSLPVIDDPLCSTQTLCSLLQIARPYQVDGLVEATVERLHQILDRRFAAAIFNAAAIGAGGGRGTGFTNLFGAHQREVDEEIESIIQRAQQMNINGTDWDIVNDGGHPPPPYRRPSTSFSMTSEASASSQHIAPQRPETLSSLRHRSSNISGSRSRSLSRKPSDLSMRHEGTRRGRAGSVSSNGTNGSAGTGGTNGAQIDWEGAHLYQRGSSAARSTLTGLSNTTDQGQSTEHIWAGHVNPVIGLQRRGLRGLAERRMRNPSALGGGMGQPGMVRNASSLSLAVPATASQQQAEHY